MKRLAVLALMLLLAAASAIADDAEAGKSLSVRTFQFRHKQAEAAAAAIKSLMSAEGTISMQPATNSLIVTDSPENLKRISAAIAQFDVAPQPFRLSVRLVAAGKVAEGGRVAEGLQDVAPKLALLRYNLLDAIGGAEVVGKEGEPGIVEMTAYRADFKFGEYDPASDSIKVTDFKLSRHEGETLAPLLKTTLNLKLGQTVILSAMRQPNSDRALMIVVSAKR
jgi:Bacterial type II/III secretion system short domain